MSRHTKPQATSSGTRSVPASSAIEGLRQLRPVPLGTPLPPPPAPYNPPSYTDADYWCAVVLGVFDDVWAHRKSSSAAPFDESYTLRPEWGKVQGSPWRRADFGKIAKRACGGGTTTSLQGRDWELARKVIAACEGQPLHKQMQLLVDSQLDSDALIHTIASVLANA